MCCCRFSVYPWTTKGDGARWDEKELNQSEIWVKAKLQFAKNCWKNNTLKSASQAKIEISVQVKSFLSHIFGSLGLCVHLEKLLHSPAAQPHHQPHSLHQNYGAKWKSAVRRKRDSPINYSLGIGHVPFIRLHLTGRHSGSHTTWNFKDGWKDKRGKSRRKEGEQTLR